MDHMRIGLFLSLIFTFLARKTTAKCSYIGFRNNNTKQHNPTCSTSPICKKSFTISHIDVPPYSTSHIFEDVLRDCCGSCLNITGVHYYRNISEVRLSKDTSPDFILPFLGQSTAVELYGYHFIPFIDVPCTYFITPKRESETVKIIRNCLELYPLIVMIVLASVISGFLSWALEKLYGNSASNKCYASCKKCCYTPFTYGLFEGFWWSFTSITPGYGAENVKSVPAKLYAVVWILIGVVMFSFLTSSFTAELMSAMQHNHPSMTAKYVGVLQYREYDAHVVVSEGGMVRETDAWNFYSDFFKLIRMLRQREIDGFIIDKYTLSHIVDYLDWKTWNIDNSTYDLVGERKADLDFFYSAEKRVYQERAKMSYGVLVRHKEVYDFFNSAVRDNRLPLENIISSEMNRLFPKHNHDNVITLPPSEKYFNDSVTTMGIIILAIFFFGVGYEVYFHKKRISCSLDEVSSMKTDPQ